MLIIHLSRCGSISLPPSPYPGSLLDAALEVNGLRTYKRMVQTCDKTDKFWDEKASITVVRTVGGGGNQKAGAVD